MLTEISTHKTTPNILKQKRPEPIFPQHTNQNQKVTIIHAFKKNLSINPLAATGVKVVDSHKTGNVLSGLTITPINAIITGTGNANHGKLNTPKPMSSTVTPKPNVVPMIPKMNSSVTISPTKIDAALASSTATLALNSKTHVNNSTVLRPIKRVQPLKISDSVTIRASSIEKSSDSDMLSHDSLTTTNDETVTPNQANAENRKKRPRQSQESTAKTVPSKRAAVDQSVPLHTDYQNLIDACKVAASAAGSDDEMKKIIDKLVKYYRRSHPEFVNSQEFRELAQNVTHQIKTQPEHMYIKLIDMLEELKTRRTEINIDIKAMETAPVVDRKEQEKEEKRAKTIRKMSDVLRKLQQRIRKLEQAEVDWDAEGNSSYMITEKLKVRAYEIYMRLCKYTGESQNAERTVRKPIKFNGTKYREFNNKLAKFVNEKEQFPDMFDVMRIMDHCNEKYGYRMDKQYQHAVGKFGLFL